MPWKKKDTRLAVLPFEVFKNVLLVSLNNLLWNAWHKTTERLRWQMLTCAPPSLRNPVTARVGACGAPSHRAAPPFPRNPPCPSGAPSVVYRDGVLIMEQGSRCLQKNVFIFSLVSRWLFTFWFASPNWPCPAHPVCTQPVFGRDIARGTPKGFRHRRFHFLVHLLTSILPSSHLLKSHLGNATAALQGTVL